MDGKRENKAKRRSNVSLSEDTIARILKNGIRLFLERGYHGTSIDDITKGASLTKGAFYWHFKSKEALLRTILKEYEKKFLDGLIQGVEDVEGSILDKFEKYFRYSAGFAYYNRELCVSFTTLSAEIVGARHPIEPEIKRIYMKYQGFVADLIRQGKKKKVFKNGLNEDLTALVIMGFHDGILLQWSMNRNVIDEESFVNHYKGIILNGLMR